MEWLKLKAIPGDLHVKQRPVLEGGFCFLKWFTQTTEGELQFGKALEVFFLKVQEDG